MKRIIVVALLLFSALSVAAQDDAMMQPFVDVGDQLVLGDEVYINQVFSDGPAWVVIHAASEEGTPGPVIGYREVRDGATRGISIDIDTTAATPTLFAMLHQDTGEIGVYEFGTVEGADGPVVVNEQVVTPAFSAIILDARAQYLADGTFTAQSVVIDAAGWLVIHADNEGAPGPVVGFAPLSAGLNTDVSVTLEDPTATLFPMLHYDTGAEGEYEFGTVEGADGPVVVREQVAVMPVITNQPQMEVADQIVTDSVYVEHVAIEGPGWVVIHADNEGAPGPVIGFGAVPAGGASDFTVDVDAEGVTPVLFPMLHVDTGAEGEYEFGTVEGADGPVIVDEAPLTYPINAASSITYSGSIVDTAFIEVEAATIDAQGWLVIHADNEGAPGSVLGFAPLTTGLNTDILVEIDVEGLTDTVFPMLHYDTGEPGIYEFGTVDGADGPVRVGEAVVVGPMTPASGE